MSVPAAAIPSPRAWRARLRASRRNHPRRSAAELFNDAYMLFWVFGVYGWVLVSGIRHHLAGQTAALDPAAWWMAAAALSAGAGLVWRGLRLVGPLLASPAEQSFGVSTPVDRRGWLFPRFIWLSLAVGIACAVVALLVSLTLRGSMLALSAVAGFATGIILTSGSVVAQPGGRSHTWWKRTPSLALFGGAGLVAMWVVSAHRSGAALPLPGFTVSPWLALMTVAVAVPTVLAALRVLGRLDVATLGAGAQLVSATVTATVSLDPSLLTGVLEARRWRRVGKVHTRPFLARRLGRPGVLVEADFRRQLRRPGTLATWVGLALTQYAVGIALPAAAPVARVILAYIATTRLTTGLRVMAGAPGLRRAVGGSDWKLRLLHTVVPAVGATLWWLATLPVSGVPAGQVDVALVIAVVSASYRAATRPPMAYDSPAVETPMGTLPVGLMLQLMRGPDLLAATVVLRLLSRG